MVVTKNAESINPEDELSPDLPQLSLDQVLPAIHMLAYQLFDLACLPCLQPLHDFLVVLDGHAGLGMITQDDHAVAVQVILKALEECIKTFVFGGLMEYVVELSIKVYELFRMQVLQACLLLPHDILEALQFLMRYP